MKNALTNAYEMSPDARQARLAGTRMLVLEETFDALVDALIASGAIPQNAASVMLEHLAERFIAASAAQAANGWEIDRGELRYQAARLKIRSGFQATPRQ